MAYGILIQISRTANGVTLKITTDNTFTAFKIYRKISAAPVVPADLLATIAGTERSYSMAAPATNGVYFFKVVGEYNGTEATSNVDFIICDTTIGYRQEIKAAIFQHLLLSTGLASVVSTRIYAGFPQSLTDYPCVAFWLDEMAMPQEGKQNYEAPTLRVKVFARSQADMDKACDYINQTIIDYSYQGKEVVIHSAKKFSETGTQLEADGLTLSVDMFFRLTTERLSLPKIP